MAARRSKVGSLPTQLREGLASCGGKSASPAFLDMLTATSQTDDVRMTVGASELGGDVSDDNDDAGARGRQRQPQGVDSAAVDIGAAPVHS